MGEIFNKKSLNSSENFFLTKLTRVTIIPKIPSVHFENLPQGARVHGEVGDAPWRKKIPVHPVFPVVKKHTFFIPLGGEASLHEHCL